MNARIMLLLVAIATGGCFDDDGTSNDPSSEDVRKSQQNVAEGRTAMAQGNLCDAVPHFDQAVRQNAANAEARFLRAIASAAKTLIDSIANDATRSSPPLIPRDLFLQSGGTIQGSSCDVCSLSVRFPDSLPDDSPTSDDVARVLTPLLLQQAAAVVGDFDQLPRDFRFTDDPTQGSILPPCLRSRSHLVNIDEGDILAATGSLRASQAVLHIVSAYDVDADVDDTANNRRTPKFVVENDPNLGKRLADPNSANELGSARDLLGGAASDCIAAIDSIRGETDDQDHDLIVFDLSQQSQIDEARRALLLFGQSLTQQVMFRRQDFSEISHDQRVDLRPFLEATINDLRPLLPEFTSAGRFDLCSFPDPTLQGMAPDLTQQDINQLIGLTCPP